MDYYEKLKDILVGYKKRIGKLEKALNFRELIFPADGKLVVPVMSSDPASPVDGEIWYNSTSHTYKGRENGVTVTFDTT